MDGNSKMSLQFRHFVKRVGCLSAPVRYEVGESNRQQDAKVTQIVPGGTGDDGIAEMRE
ncbi:MAG: hypothetical protein ACRD3Q_18800 [Terriglobales bacterium]